MRTDESGNSAKIAMWYKDNPLTLEELMKFEGRVTKESWKYLVGKLCLSERQKHFGNKRAAGYLDRLGVTIGYAGVSIKNLASFSNSIDRVSSYLPDIAADILNGNTRLTEKDTYALAKMDFVEINAIMVRLSQEKTPAKIVIAEQKALRLEFTM